MRAKSMKVYPRPDTEFKKKDSLDFHTQKSAIYETRPHNNLIHFYSWLAYGLCGILTGIATWLFEIMMETIVVQRWKLTSYFMLEHGGLGVGYVIYLVFTLLVGLAASCLTVFLSPMAAGGGGSELMGYFNGVNY
jgi:H+/Cl- antiporter ClcA